MRDLMLWALVASCVGLASNLDFTEAIADEAHYCAMVRQYQLDPNTGWPDYRGIYDEVCVRRYKTPVEAYKHLM